MHRIMSALVGCCLVALAGCATAPEGGESPSTRDAMKARPPLQAGMAAAAVVQLWGEPQHKETVPDGQARVEVWTYEGAVVASASPVATSTRQVMAYNPIYEGGVVPTTEPVYSIRTRRVMTLHQVALVDGVVARVWEVQRELTPVVN